MTRTLQNEHVALRIDACGRPVSLVNKATGTELIMHPDAAEAWRIIVPTGRHTVAFLYGSRQAPPRIERQDREAGPALVLNYEGLDLAEKRLPVRIRFVFCLPEDSARITAHVELENESESPIDEVEFPIVGGLGGFPARGGRRVLNLAAGQEHGILREDVLHRGLPEAGRGSNHFARENETAMWDAHGTIAPRQWWVGTGMWLDFWSEREGLYAGLHADEPPDFAWKIEKYPKETPNEPAHAYPPETPRWLRAHALHMPQVAPGGTWQSPPVILMPHAGDWHAGADVYGEWRRRGLTLCRPPAWMDEFVGWTEILGKTYLGEVYHDYAQCADAVIRDAKVTGLDFVFYYGHTAIGAEGADYDYGPAPDLGGEEGFRRMIERLHRRSIRIMLLDHLHRWINRDLPQYEGLGLERYAVRKEDGSLQTARWWKETGLSCLRLAGPTPLWVDMCPACGPWREHYLEHVTRMIELGVDGLELDTFDPSPCWSADHGHRPGEHMLRTKLDWMADVRRHAKRLNPDFALFAETMLPEARTVLDGFYTNRCLDEDNRVYRYLFPEIREQAALVGNYAYDQVNKALQLGIGVETEVWGLRKTALAACPELARYIGEVNRLKRRYPDVLLRGTFRDVLGAEVKGDVFHSVIVGPGGRRAVVLRNPHDRAQRATVHLKSVRRDCEMILWRPFKAERRVRSLPVTVVVGAQEAAVLLVLPK
jgi:hypothetical protein